MADTFTLDLQKFVQKTGANINLVIRKVAFELFRSVIIKSPVDTGRFKSNWQVNIGAAPSGVLPTKDKSGAAALARVATETLQFQVGQVIYLVNNLSYARALEYGWSKQAPAGMVRISVASYTAALEKIVKQVNP